MTIALFAEADSYDDDKDPRTFNSVEDAVALTDRTQAPEPDQFTPERFTLLFRVMREAINTVTDLFPNPAVGNGPEQLQRGRGENDPVGHSPSFRLARSQEMSLPALASRML